MVQLVWGQKVDNVETVENSVEWQVLGKTMY